MALSFKSNSVLGKLVSTAGKVASAASAANQSAGSVSAGNTSKTNSSVDKVSVSNSQQQSIKDQMAANSQAWHTASAEEKKRLEQANKDLAAQLGGLSFDAGSGTWSGNAGSSSGGSSGGSSGTKSGGSSGGSSSGGTTGTPSGGYTQKYTGGNAALDAALAKYSAAYNDARKRALAGDQNAVMEMRNANDAANQLRNQYGYAAELANEDINYVKDMIGYYGSSGKDMMGVGYGDWSGSGTVTPPAQTAPVSPTAPTTPVTPTAPTGGSSSSGGTGSAAPADDLSNYLEEMYAAKKRSALSQLEAAYNKNVSALDAAKGALAPGYQDARNQAAANSARTGRNFAEYAAASGLNSGAMGQAELARNVSLQNDLGSIDRQEADSLSDLELQRAQMESEYNAAIAQAESSGDYELAASLYEEKVRQSEAALQQQMLAYQRERDAVADSQWQKQFNFNVGQADEANRQWQAEMDYKNAAYQDKLQNTNRSQMADFGSYFLKNGVMPSQEMLDAMGITAADAQSYLNALNLQASLKTAGSGGGGGTPEKDEVKTADYDGLFKAARDSGYPKSFIANNYKNYGFTSSTGIYDEYTEWAKSPNGGPVLDTPPSPNYGYQNLVSQLSELEDRLNPSAVPTRAAAMVRSAYENGSITENAAKRLLSQYGMN